MRVSCTKRYGERLGEYGEPVETVEVECSRCGALEWAFGTHGRSERRALAQLNENCPRGESNYYAVTDSHTPHLQPLE